MIKKYIKKIISIIIPKGHNKEKAKLIFYNLFKSNRINFKIENKQNKTIFKTSLDNFTIVSNEALYLVASHFELYEHFYKTKPNDIIIDAGANVGHLSLYFSKKVKEIGQVHCFEPDKINIDFLKSNMSLNDLDQNIFIHNLLLWKENTLLDFEEAGTVGSSAVWFSGKNNLVKKQAVSIDNWVKDNNISKIDFIKMDIEGAEIEAIEGCLNTILNCKPNFAIASYHIVNNEPTYLKLESFFKKINYPHKTMFFKDNEIITFAGESVKNLIN